MSQIALPVRSSATSSQARKIALLVVAIAFFVSLVLVPVGIQQNRSDLLYINVATIAFILPLLVALSRPKFDIFEPVSLLALAIFFGSTLRSFYLVLSDSSRTDFLMMGTDFNSVLNNSFTILFGVIAFCLGYIIFNFRFSLNGNSRYRISRTKVFFVSFVILGLSTVGLVLLVRENGIDLGNLFEESVKRPASFMTDEGEVVYGAGWVQTLSRSGQYAFLVLAGALVARLIPRNPFWNSLIAVSALIAMIGPYLSSSRSAIIVMFINLACLAYYYSRLRMRTIVLAAIASVALVVVMGELRSVNQTGTNQYESAVDVVLGSGNSIDFVRTSAIIDRVPDRHDFLYGQSYLSLLTAFVPRELWPDKPNPSLGPWVKSTLFGQTARNNGWPPGMIAEAYINFGVGGVGIVLFIFGMALRCIYESAKPHLGVSFVITLLYACGIWRLAFGTIGLNFAQGVSQTIQYVLPMAIILFLVRAKGSHRADAS